MRLFNPTGFGVQFLLFVLSFSLIQAVEAQTDTVNSDTSNVFCPNCYNQRSSYPTKLVQPYSDIILGFSTFKYSAGGYTEIGIAGAIRGGVQVGQNLLLGTAISINTIDGYETNLVLPFELGYRTNNQRFEIVSSVGYTYVLLLSRFYDEDSIEGRTAAFDVYWRPSVSYKNMRLVFAVGGMMYDFGDSVLYRNSRTGPKGTFRCRFGIGF